MQRHVGLGKKEENEHKVRQLLTYMAPRLQLIYAYHKQNLSVTLANKSFNTTILETKLKLKEMKQKMKPYLLNKTKNRIVFFSADIIEQFHLGLIILDIERNNTQYKYCLKGNPFSDIVGNFFVKRN